MTISRLESTVIDDLLIHDSGAISNDSLGVHLTTGERRTTLHSTRDDQRTETTTGPLNALLTSLAHEVSTSDDDVFYGYTTGGGSIAPTQLPRHGAYKTEVNGSTSFTSEVTSDALISDSAGGATYTSLETGHYTLSATGGRQAAGDLVESYRLSQQSLTTDSHGKRAVRSTTTEHYEQNGTFVVNSSGIRTDRGEFTLIRDDTIASDILEIERFEGVDVILSNAVPATTNRTTISAQSGQIHSESAGAFTTIDGERTEEGTELRVTTDEIIYHDVTTTFGKLDNHIDQGGAGGLISLSTSTSSIVDGALSTTITESLTFDVEDEERIEHLLSVSMEDQSSGAARSTQMISGRQTHLNYEKLTTNSLLTEGSWNSHTVQSGGSRNTLIEHERQQESHFTFDELKTSVEIDGAPGSSFITTTSYSLQSKGTEDHSFNSPAPGENAGSLEINDSRVDFSVERQTSTQNGADHKGSRFGSNGFSTLHEKISKSVAYVSGAAQTTARTIREENDTIHFGRQQSNVVLTIAERITDHQSSGGNIVDLKNTDETIVMANDIQVSLARSVDTQSMADIHFASSKLSQSLLGEDRTRRAYGGSTTSTETISETNLDGVITTESHSDGRFDLQYSLQSHRVQVNQYNKVTTDTEINGYVSDSYSNNASGQRLSWNLGMTLNYHQTNASDFATQQTSMSLALSESGRDQIGADGSRRRASDSQYDQQFVQGVTSWHESYFASISSYTSADPAITTTNTHSIRVRTNSSGTEVFHDEANAGLGGFDGIPAVPHQSDFELPLLDLPAGLLPSLELAAGGYGGNSYPEWFKEYLEKVKKSEPNEGDLSGLSPAQMRARQREREAKAMDLYRQDVERYQAAAHAQVDAEVAGITAGRTPKYISVAAAGQVPNKSLFTLGRWEILIIHRTKADGTTETLTYFRDRGRNVPFQYYGADNKNLSDADRARSAIKFLNANDVLSHPSRAPKHPEDYTGPGKPPRTLDDQTAKQLEQDGQAVRIHNSKGDVITIARADGTIASYLRNPTTGVYELVGFHKGDVNQELLTRTILNLYAQDPGSAARLRRRLSGEYAKAHGESAAFIAQSELFLDRAIRAAEREMYAVELMRSGSAYSVDLYLLAHQISSALKRASGALAAKVFIYSAGRYLETVDVIAQKKRELELLRQWAKQIRENTRPEDPNAVYWATLRSGIEFLPLASTYYAFKDGRIVDGAVGLVGDTAIFAGGLGFAFKEFGAARVGFQLLRASAYIEASAGGIRIIQGGVELATGQVRAGAIHLSEGAIRFGISGALNPSSIEAIRTGAFLSGAKAVGEGLGLVAGRSLKVTERGIGIVERHLAQFGEFGPNAAMIERLKLAIKNSERITGADASFYLHELNEATRMARGMTYEEAHQAALNLYGVSPYSVYHPEVISQFPEWFNANWFRFWGMIP